MKKTIFGKTLAALVLALLMTSAMTAITYAKTIPDEYREFTKRGDAYYHAMTMYTNYEVETGKIEKKTINPSSGDSFEAYYVSIGNKTLKLATPDGEILTAQELDEYFSQIPAPQTVTVDEVDPGCLGEQQSGFCSATSPLAWEKELLALVNAERERLGIAPVELDTDLTKIAALKAKEMAELNYFGHTSPNYGKPSEFAKHYGYTKTVGENIHRGTSSTAKQVFDIWMNSTTGHRENMLNPKWKYIGIGTAERCEYSGDGAQKSTEHYNVQLFSR